jgi:predicted nucleotidyltransferase component of viral defense system
MPGGYPLPNAIEQMLAKYDCRTPDNYKNALKEIIQEIALLGLSRSGFFDIAAFYGGTALRIFYELERFSEDLDFSLLSPNSQFDISAYADAIKNELGAYGFDMDVVKKEKHVDTAIDSAFIKGNTLIQMMKIQSISPPVSGIHKNEVLKIKLEVDTAPPDGAEFVIKYSLRPVPHSVRVFSDSSLFSGKIHALLCRSWNGERMKGRDLYDFIWYIKQNIPLNLAHLRNRLIQTGHLDRDEHVTLEKTIGLLHDKFDRIDYKQAKTDIAPFIKDPGETDVWSKEFFKAISEKIAVSGD